MTGSFRQSQSLLHTWSGLLLGWLLFLVFVTGTIAFWREGMNRWMRPELPRVEQPMKILEGAQAFLTREAPNARTWFITMASDRSPGAQVSWRPQPHGSSTAVRRRGGNQALIDAYGNPARVRETHGGEFFYRFHFDLYYLPVIWARWLVALATMMMLVAILSGIVTHKRIFREFFTLRRGKGPRSWLDGHNATAVLALPFHLMITYTGLVTLMALIMPWAVTANFGSDAKLFEMLYPQAAQAVRQGVPAPLVPLVLVVRDAEQRLGGPAGLVEVSEPGDAAARVHISRTPASMLSSRTPILSYDGVSGRLLWQSPEQGPAVETAGVLIGLHAGRFADSLMRWIYFLCGVAGSIMVASGLVFWAVKRRARLSDREQGHPGLRLVERLNPAVIAGFPLGVAAMLWANRLLPPALPGRADWEVHVLFLAWTAAMLLAVLRRPFFAWPVLLALTGSLLAALPVYNLFATERGLFATVPAGDFAMAGVDLTLLLFGLGYLAVAARVKRHRPARPRVERRTGAMSSAQPSPAE